MIRCERLVVERETLCASYLSMCFSSAICQGEKTLYDQLRWRHLVWVLHLDPNDQRKPQTAEGFGFFLAVLEVWEVWIWFWGGSVSRSTTLVQTEISARLISISFVQMEDECDFFPRVSKSHIWRDIAAPAGWTGTKRCPDVSGSLTWLQMDPLTFPSSTDTRLTFVFLPEMSWEPPDGFLWNPVQTVYTAVYDQIPHHPHQLINNCMLTCHCRHVARPLSAFSSKLSCCRVGSDKYKDPNHNNRYLTTLFMKRTTKKSVIAENVEEESIIKSPTCSDLSRKQVSLICIIIILMAQL